MSLVVSVGWFGRVRNRADMETRMEVCVVVVVRLIISLSVMMMMMMMS